MATADEITRMRKLADEQMRTADSEAKAAKEALRRQIAEYDKQTSSVQNLKRLAQADLGKIS